MVCAKVDTLQMMAHSIQEEIPSCPFPDQLVGSKSSTGHAVDVIAAIDVEVIVVVSKSSPAWPSRRDITCGQASSGLTGC